MEILEFHIEMENFKVSDVLNIEHDWIGIAINEPGLDKWIEVEEIEFNAEFEMKIFDEWNDSEDILEPIGKFTQDKEAEIAIKMTLS